MTWLRFAPLRAQHLCAGVVLLAGVPCVGSPQAAAQSGAEARVPLFRVGESLDYRVHVALGGNVGTGQMRVEGPIADRDRLVWRLVFELEAGRGPIRASDHTVSHLDPQTFAVTRFEKTERHPLSRSEERVVVDLANGTWRDGDGTVNPLGHARPLDELSFMYFLRGIPLDRDTTFEVSRHFDEARNPTVIHVLGEELVETPVGIFRTRVVEMHVKDPKRFGGTGAIRINFDVADCHVPVRIVSRMPVLGATTLLLTGWVSPPRYPGAMACD